MTLAYALADSPLALPIVATAILAAVSAVVLLGVFLFIAHYEAARS